jgi:hypothetical protein
MSWIDPDPSRVGSHHVQIFIPSVDREGDPIPLGQEYWVQECLEMMGTQFGGGTALPPARGVWRDDDRGGELVYDQTVVAFSYVERLTDDTAQALLEFVARLGKEGKQGEVGVYVDGAYYGIQDFDTSGEPAGPTDLQSQGGNR